MGKDEIYRKYKLKPYKREGKIHLYKLVDAHSIGIAYEIPKEEYCPIPSFEDKYWISKEGEILDILNSKTVKTYIGTDQYEHVVFQYYGKRYRKRVHSLMGKTFLGKPPVVNHRDGNKSNNKLENLERSTHSDNIRHAYQNGYYSSRGSEGTRVIAKNLDSKEVYEFKSLREAQRVTGVERHRIKRIIEKTNVNNTNWEFEFK